MSSLGASLFIGGGNWSKSSRYGVIIIIAIIPKVHPHIKNFLARARDFFFEVGSMGNTVTPGYNYGSWFP